MPLPQGVAEELRRIVGRESVVDAPNDLRIFERDGSIEGAIPDAVVLASTTKEVSDVIKVAAKHRVPVVPRGAGTGLSGGAVTIRGGIALQVTRMRRILEIDPVAQTALVEPGVVNQELSLVAAEHGLFYAPDPSSQKACTIGGNAAENSGGPHCLYYGVTTNHVIGLEIVLANGEIAWLGGGAPDRVGLDLLGVMGGSERTLGTITRTKVRRPQGRDRGARPHPAQLLPARRRRAPHPAARRAPPRHRDRRALPAAGRQRLPRRRRQPPPQHPVRPPRRRRAGAGRAGGRGDAAGGGRAGRHAERRARHRHREEPVHAMDLPAGRPGGN